MPPSKPQLFFHLLQGSQAANRPIFVYILSRLIPAYQPLGSRLQTHWKLVSMTYIESYLMEFEIGFSEVVWWNFYIAFTLLRYTW